MDRDYLALVFRLLVGSELVIVVFFSLLTFLSFGVVLWMDVGRPDFYGTTHVTA
jgi:hypothetical protein